MPFERPTLQELVERAMADTESRLPGADTKLRRGNLQVLPQGARGRGARPLWVFGVYGQAGHARHGRGRIFGPLGSGLGRAAPAGCAGHR